MINKSAVNQERLDAIGISIARKREEAIRAREDSGVEKIWRMCEDNYLGIDDANRHEFHGAKWIKSTSMEGPISTNTVASDNRSTAYVRLTSRYVDFATAKICEITLPIDDKAFSLEPTPIPETVADKSQIASVASGVMDKMRGWFGAKPAPAPTQAVPAQAAPMAPGMPAQQPDPVEQAIAKADEPAKKAERRIYDWMIEAKYQAEMRKVIHDAARIGTGVLKGPFPERFKSQSLSRQGDMVALQIEEKTAPALRRIDAGNLYPDPACGENIHDGDHIFERDYLSPKRLRELKKRKGWMAGQIDKVLKEGPGKMYVTDSKSEADEHRFERWHYYGSLSREDLEAAGVKVPDDCEEAYGIITLVNDTVVRCILNPLDSGRFPYQVFPWSRRADHWTGVGVGEQMFMPQKMANAATRALLNNSGMSAGIQLVVDRGSIEPANGSWVLDPNKVWWKVADAIIDDVRKAFYAVEFPNIQQKLMPVIEYALRLAEEHTSIPLVTQGNYVDTASPQTFGQAELQNNNAHALLRNVANTIDDTITEPVVNALYEWLLLDPDVPDNEKGDFTINAHGSIAMVERAIQEMTITQMIALSANPAFGADPKKVFALMLKTKRIDPRDVQYSEEDLAKLSQQPPPKAPQVEAAEINAQARLQAAEIAAHSQVARETMRNDTEQQRMAMDTDRDAAYTQELRERTQTNARARIEELKIKRELAMLNYANQRNITIDQVRGKLAEKAMTLRVQRELAAAGGGKAPQVAQPMVEPPGRAPDGESFQK